jgi:transcription-repair coupling factor (superfamily II helicase)
VLVPTTILADQHQRTFSERFADFPVRVEMLSRFQTAKEQVGVMNELAGRKVDVIIGTHRLLSPDVTFKGLGLIIVDEEHRFGVKHKERLKQLKLETDVLTLTATPIPRTLHQSLAGLRDMTLMQTAPRDRSPVLTFVEPNDDGLGRGGDRPRARSRRAGVLRPQPDRDDRGGVGPPARIVPRARIAGRPRSDAREGPRGRDAPVRESRHRHPRLDAHRRDRARRAEREHDVREQRAPLRAGAALPAARARRDGRTAAPIATSSCPTWSTRTRSAASRCSSTTPSSARGYAWPSRTWSCAAPATCSGPSRAASCTAVGFDMYLRMLDETVNRLVAGDSAPKLVPADVSLDQAAYLPDRLRGRRRTRSWISTGAWGLPLAPTRIEALRTRSRYRFGALPSQARPFLRDGLLGSWGLSWASAGNIVRATKARITSGIPPSRA